MRFCSPTACNAQAFVALLEHDSVHEAVETASPEVASLLRRVIVEEPMAGDPDWAIPSTLSSSSCSATRRSARLSDVEVASRVSDDSWEARAAEAAQVQLWLDELGESGSGRDAADRLVAWLIQREPEG